MSERIEKLQKSKIFIFHFCYIPLSSTIVSDDSAFVLRAVKLMINKATIQSEKEIVPSYLIKFQEQFFQ